MVLQILDAPDAPDLSASDMSKTLLLEVRRWGVGEDGKENVSASLETRVPRQFTGVCVERGGRACISSVKHHVLSDLYSVFGGRTCVCFVCRTLHMHSIAYITCNESDV